jgi:Ca2+-binding EF-hand superfamily protein
MIDAISSSNSYMSYLQQTQLTKTQSSQPDLFTLLDTDDSGGISQSELDTWAKNMSKLTGTTIDTTDAVSTYDTNGDGVLSASELKSFLDASGIWPPSGGPPLGPPPLKSSSTAKTANATTGSASSIISSYDTDGDGLLSSSELQAFLDDNAETSSPSNSTSVLQALSAYRMNASQLTADASAWSYINNLALTINFSA